MSSFDARALTDPVDRREVSRHRREMRKRFPKTRGGDETGSNLLYLLLGGFFIVFGTFFFLGARSLDFRPAPAGLIAAFIGVFLVIRGVIGLVRHRSGTRWYRLDRFARANGLAYIPGVQKPDLPGMIFRVGSSRHSRDLVRGSDPRFVEFGNYRYVTGSGDDRKTHRWGYIAVRLDAPLPHIVLDAKGNNGLFGSNLPVSLRSSQKLSLEGDFDRHFVLSCPEGYEADALYLFTPDIMERFVDSAAQLDIEIVDDWLFFYLQNRDASTLDPDQWAWEFSIVGAMLDKLAQWGRWRDERLAAPVDPDHTEADPLRGVGTLTPPPRGVAEEGRRLKTSRASWVAVVIFSLAVYVLVRFLSG
ncbi:hypothetical protein [Microbacterium sp. gxy059]|uniref:hypothetical protein n=1 Tax=Microbacterium sp. gxy059 TaxID=2957199 RepID=UPI003D955D44